MAKGRLKEGGQSVFVDAIEFRVLGPLELRVGERALALGGPRQRALLALLLLHANEVVARDRLIDELWAGEPPSSAATALHVHVSQLRRALPADRELLLTHPPGYLIALEPQQLDLNRFELLAGEGTRALADGDPASAAASLQAALALWRGPPLADLTYEPFAQVPILRLEELRLAALEARIDADLALGHHADLVGELSGLVAAHPLRERLRGQLMLALYRSGRQIEALETYRDVRREFVEQLGIEPSDMLQRLQHAILRHDRQLEIVPAPDRAILVLPSSEHAAGALVELAAPLVLGQGRALVLTRLIADANALAEASRLALERRSGLLARGVPARAAAFVSDEPAIDTIRMAVQLHADLLLLDAPAVISQEGPFPAPLFRVLAEAPCDVGLLAAQPEPPAGAVVVPFGGGEHDWAAIEVGAWIARSRELPLKLVGVHRRREKRDASRLLADASLAVQYALGIAAEPLLVAGGADGLFEAAQQATLLVAGLSDRWRREGLGKLRATIARESAAPVLFVRRGVRPSGIAPAERGTRYTWSLGPPRAS